MPCLQRSPYEEAAAQREHEGRNAFCHARYGVAAVAKVPRKGLQREVGALQWHQEVVPFQRHPVPKELLHLWPGKTGGGKAGAWGSKAHVLMK